MLVELITSRRADLTARASAKAAKRLAAVPAEEGVMSGVPPKSPSTALPDLEDSEVRRGTASIGARRRGIAAISAAG